MLVKDFVDGNIAIRIYDDVEPSELESLEAAINEVAGRYLGETQNYSGFAQFCSGSAICRPEQRGIRMNGTLR